MNRYRLLAYGILGVMVLLVFYPPFMQINRSTDGALSDINWQGFHLITVEVRSKTNRGLSPQIAWPLYIAKILTCLFLAFKAWRWSETRMQPLHPASASN